MVVIISKDMILRAAFFPLTQMLEVVDVIAVPDGELPPGSSPS
jgi:hypothetical protein